MDSKFADYYNDAYKILYIPHPTFVSYPKYKVPNRRVLIGEYFVTPETKNILIQHVYESKLQWTIPIVYTSNVYKLSNTVFAYTVPNSRCTRHGLNPHIIDNRKIVDMHVYDISKRSIIYKVQDIGTLYVGSMHIITEIGIGTVKVITDELAIKIKIPPGSICGPESYIVRMDDTFEVRRYGNNSGWSFNYDTSKTYTFTVCNTFVILYDNYVAYVYYSGSKIVVESDPIILMGPDCAILNSRMGFGGVVANSTGIHTFEGDCVSIPNSNYLCMYHDGVTDIRDLYTFELILSIDNFVTDMYQIPRHPNDILRIAKLLVPLVPFHLSKYILSFIM